MSKIQEEISIRDRGKEELVELLKDLQGRFGYLSGELIAQISQDLGISVGDIYGIATFYSFLATRPQGRNIIRICKSLPCDLRDYQAIVETLRRELGINPGETTDDGRFSLELTNCIGACDKAPAMMINDTVYVDLTPEKISEILNEYK